MDLPGVPLTSQPGRAIGAATAGDGGRGIGFRRRPRYVGGRTGDAVTPVVWAFAHGVRGVGNRTCDDLAAGARRAGDGAAAALQPGDRRHLLRREYEPAGWFAVAPDVLAGREHRERHSGRPG